MSARPGGALPAHGGPRGQHIGRHRAPGRDLDDPRQQVRQAPQDAADTPVRKAFLAEVRLAECDERDARRQVRRVKEAKFPRTKRLTEQDDGSATSRPLLTGRPPPRGVEVVALRDGSQPLLDPFEVSLGLLDPGVGGAASRGLHRDLVQELRCPFHDLAILGVPVALLLIDQRLVLLRWSGWPARRRRWDLIISDYEPGVSGLVCWRIGSWPRRHGGRSRSLRRPAAARPADPQLGERAAAYISAAIVAAGLSVESNVRSAGIPDLSL